MNAHHLVFRFRGRAACLAAAAALGCVRLFSAEPITPAGAIELFNGRTLDGWTSYAKEGEPAVGQTWNVSDGVIQCSGMPNGYIRTESRYRDYRLTVEWRWTPAPAPLDAQGRPRKRNSGVLVHMQGDDAVWPKSFECQLMEGNAGDFYAIGGVESAELLAERTKLLAAAGNDEEARTKARASRRVAKEGESSEKPLGEWNVYDIICRDDTVTVWVNGVEQNHATALTVREGHICLQSEGAPIEFRNVKLEPLPQP